MESNKPIAITVMIDPDILEDLQDTARECNIDIGLLLSAAWIGLLETLEEMRPAAYDYWLNQYIKEFPNDSE